MAPESITEYVVEGLARGVRWETFGVWEKNMSLNPSTCLKDARKVRATLESYRKKGRTGWQGSRIVKVTTVREVVE